MSSRSDETALAEAVGVYTPEPAKHRTPGTRRELVIYTVIATLISLGLVLFLPYIPTV